MYRWEKNNKHNPSKRPNEQQQATAEGRPQNPNRNPNEKQPSEQ